MGSDGPPRDWTITETYPASARSVPAVRHAVDDLLTTTAIDPQRRSEVLLAVTEAATNAVTHGSTSPDDTIDVTAELFDDTLTVAIRDYGKGIVPGHPSPGLGVGLPLVFNLSDHAEIQHAQPGTRVTRRFALHVVPPHT
jgi:anti-sigma regulatory factor (Ser/Thr protein kinase)